MEITDVKVIPVDDEKLKAFVSMPSKKRKDGTFKDIAHPLNNQMRQYLEEKVLGIYRQQVASGAPAPPPSGGAETTEKEGSEG